LKWKKKVHASIRYDSYKQIFKIKFLDVYIYVIYTGQ